MNFLVLTSEKDGGYDPVAQHYWNVANGLEPRFTEYEVEQDEQLNSKLVATISTFRSSLESSSRVNPPDITGCLRYSEQSAQALCDLLDAFVEYEVALDEAWQEEGVEIYEFLQQFVDMFTSPQCPRPVIWHLISKIAASGMSWVCDDQKTPFLLYAIGRNPVVGDQAFAAFLAEYKNGGAQDGGLIATSNAYYAFKNPSLTIGSLEKLRCDYWFDMDSDWIEMYVSPQLFRPTDNFGVDSSIDRASTMDGRRFTFIVARLFDELKLGRLSWERMADSPSQYFRTVAFYWPRTPVAIKSGLLQAGVLELNREAEEFLMYSFNNPYMSALSADLATRPLP